MTKFIKRVLPVVLSLLLLTNFAFATTFPDLSGATWAKEYIARMSSLGIVKGYVDGTFKPLNGVTKYEAIVVMYRTLLSQGLVTQAKGSELKAKHAAVLSQYKVPTWDGLQEGVSFFIENDVMKAADLATFVVNGQQKNISREQLSVYLGKMVNLYLKEDINQLISLPFKDSTKIPFESLKFINILYKYQIMSGDNNNNFNPLDDLNRAQLSKVMAVSIDVLTTKQPVEKKVEATISTLLTDSKRVVFYEKNSTTISRLEDITDAIVITIGGQPATFAQLVKDMEVTLTYRNDKLVSIAAAQIINTTASDRGTISELITFNNKSYIYFQSEVHNKVVSYEVAANAKITLSDVPITFAEISKGDVVTVKLIGEIATEIALTKRLETHKGLLKEIVVDGTPRLVMTIAGVDKSFEIDQTAKVIRNGVAKTLSSLLIGDQIEVATVFSKVTSITATGVAGKEVGVITKVSIGSRYEISIRDVNGNENTYTIGDGAKVIIDGQVKTYFDLRTNFTVEAKVESAVITEITASSKIAKDHVVGLIETVYTDLKVLVINVNGVKYTVNHNAATKMLGTSALALNFDSFKVGQVVFAYGIMQDRIILAETILRLE